MDALVTFAVLSTDAVMTYVRSGDHCRSVTAKSGSCTGRSLSKSPVCSRSEQAKFRRDTNLGIVLRDASVLVPGDDVLATTAKASHGGLALVTDDPQRPFVCLLGVDI